MVKSLEGKKSYYARLYSYVITRTLIQKDAYLRIGIYIYYKTIFGFMQEQYNSGFYFLIQTQTVHLPIFLLLPHL